ncbi:MAG: hypothetical protein MHMPM18_000161 [Marteilia pararefringens]
MVLAAKIDKRDLLSNFEVHRALCDNSDRNDNNSNNRLDTFADNITSYLSHVGSFASINEDKIKMLSDVCKRMALTMPEMYQLMYLCPKSEVELQLLISDIYERLSEEQINELLEFMCKEF